MTRSISREDFKAMLDAGRRLVHAGLYERQDYLVQLTRSYRIPVRDVTDEPDQHHRICIGGKP